MRLDVVLICVMNILRLVAAEKEKKKHLLNPEYQKLETQASCKNKGDAPISIPKEELKKTLDPVSYRVTQERGTERAYSGKYLRMKSDGVYTCVVCDNPLFRSEQKYESGCGWPAFNDVIAQGKVTLNKDTSHGMVRTEVTCSRCGAHLGHVFEDGPPPTGLRYCINSAAMNFKSVPNEPDRVENSNDDKENIPVDRNKQIGGTEKLKENEKVKIKSEL